MSQENKASLRKRILLERSSISDGLRCQWDRCIEETLLNSEEWRWARRILAYCSMPDEVGTDGLLKAALDQGKRLALPRCLKGVPCFDPVEVRDLETDLVSGKFRGLREPVAALSAWDLERDGAFDLIVVPGVAFDRKGNRLGFGAGMYDRFLEKLSTCPPLVALAYNLQIVERIESEAHDWRMDAIVTETGIIRISDFESNS
jgi:5-formyltetrahydrofolate cyclo-ligase